MPSVLVIPNLFRNRVDQGETNFNEKGEQLTSMLLCSLSICESWQFNTHLPVPNAQENIFVEVKNKS